MRAKNIRVLIVDDSIVKRSLIKEALKGKAEFEVVGTASDGEEAVRLCRQLKPDVVTMDINMPKLDGLEATRLIMREMPTPILVVSATAKGEAKFTSTALKYGALEFLPYQEDWEKFKEGLTMKLQVCASVKVIRYVEPMRPRERDRREKIVSQSTERREGFEAMVIGSSTGGPTALYHIFSSFAEALPIPVFVVQHMTAGFTTGLVSWLAEGIEMSIKEAEDGERIVSGQVYVCPGGYHMKVDRQRRIVLESIGANDIYKPSVDKIFASVAEVYGSRVISIVLTGMGKDGLQGAQKIKQEGGVVVAQGAGSAVVDGMPRAVREAGIADYTLELPMIPNLVKGLLKS